jgi:molybdenum cofactor biosynthesis protein B
MSYEQHQESSQQMIARCAVITLSDTRNESTDTSGKRLRELLTEAGHTVAQYRILPDEPASIAPVIGEFIMRADLDVILTNGGTGIARRDQTIDVIQRVIDLPLPGFGELFRMLSYEQIGSGAMLSRAVAGIARGKILFAMPGSTKAVELAMTKLILPELKHLLGELRKHGST